MQDGPIVKKSLAFSIDIIRYYRDLVRKKEYDIARQLKRSGTSIGANVFEAQYAESKLDFIHKMKLASKEASETLYWLTLCGQIPDFDVPQKMLSEIKEILAILSAIIITTKKNLK
ncbi:MAG TPA: four helix bundle protein [Puia sp.]|jgi:four helix bundle protein|nr:four helix bundle protein [Puia sp.]